MPRVEPRSAGAEAMLAAGADIILPIITDLPIPDRRSAKTGRFRVDLS
jgi:hypothetical protein